MNRGLVHYNWFWIEAHVGLVDYSWKTKLLKFPVFFSIVVEFYVDVQSGVFRFSWVTNFSSSFLNKSEKNRASYERFAGMLWEEICNHLQNDTNPNFTLSFFFLYLSVKMIPMTLYIVDLYSRLWLDQQTVMLECW